MAWYDVSRVNSGIDSLGRVSVHYGGKRHRRKVPPEVAAAITLMCSMEREQHEEEVAAESRERGAERALEDRLQELRVQVKALVDIELGLCGYHQHKRGEWRLKRGTRTPGGGGSRDADLDPSS